MCKGGHKMKEQCGDLGHHATLLQLCLSVAVCACSAPLDELTKASTKKPMELLLPSKDD